MNTPVILKTVLNINQLVAVNRLEPKKALISEGEKHDFWELIYMETGEACVLSGDADYTLKEGKVIFIPPNKQHQVRATTENMNAVRVAFVCHDRAMSFLGNKVFSLNTAQKSLLSLILNEAAQSFSLQPGAPLTGKMIKRKNAPFGGEQLIKTYLEQLLISLIRSNKPPLRKTDLPDKNGSEDKIVEAIAQYLKSNITNRLYLDDICRNICFSKSYVKQLFSRKKGEGIMQFFTSLKIDESKRLLAEENLNITQVSEMLGFSSVHYFSRIFKNKTGMSPREYLKSINKNSLL